MRYLIQIVHFNPEGDGVHAMYINDKYFCHGDYYHDKIDDWISGFLYCLKWVNEEVVEIEYEVKSYGIPLIEECEYDDKGNRVNYDPYKHLAAEVSYGADVPQTFSEIFDVIVQCGEKYVEAE